MKQNKKGFYEKYVKRPLDVLCVLPAIVIMSPVYCITALMVRIKLGSPVIFVQERPGLNEKIFKMYKFRTMTDAEDRNGKLLSDEERLTPFGEKLRAASLDELPELFNILKGDMSIIGPRPQLVRDMVFMSDEQRRRHTVRPGLSGLAQINGRNNIDWELKLDYDLEYIKHITFSGDLKILLKTFGKVMRKDDINTDGMATAADYGDYLLAKGKITQEEYSAEMRQADTLIEEYRKRK